MKSRAQFFWRLDIFSVVSLAVQLQKWLDSRTFLTYSCQTSSLLRCRRWKVKTSKRQVTTIINFISYLLYCQLLTCVNFRLVVLYSRGKSMGNANNSEYSLEKGEGFRIIKVQDNSPFLGKVEEFFDFIIQVIPPQSQKSASEILDKLSGPPPATASKSPVQLLNESAGKVIKAKIVSTKYRKVRTIQVDLSVQKPQNSDIAGLALRKERFDEVFDTYFPITDIQSNSPVQKAGIREGQFLIGCLEYPYKTIDAFMEGLYERYFDKQIQSKAVHLVLYDLPNDNLTVKEVMLKRGWGGKGLLGCEFLQGMLNKFPHNLEQYRKTLRNKESEMKEVRKLRSELGDCDGASRSLMESLESQRNKRGRQLRDLKSILNISPPNVSQISKPREQLSANKLKPESNPNASNPSESRRIEQLQRRVSALEHTLLQVKEYINRIEIGEEDQNQRQ